jgi:hypothetical protein
LCQIAFLLLVVTARAMDQVPQRTLLVLGALVFVTTVVSGLDYVITYTRKAIDASRRQRAAVSR